MKKLQAVIQGLVLAVVVMFATVAANACDCPTSGDTAEFSVGTPVYVGLNDNSDATYDVPVYVSTLEDVTFTQMTLKYNCNLIYFESGHPGDDVVNQGEPFEDENENGANSYVLVNFVGEYTGCNQQAYVFQFSRVGGTGGALTWNTTDGGPNSYCHLNWDNTGGGDGKITPSSICFEHGSIPHQTGCTYPCWCDCQLEKADHHNTLPRMPDEPVATKPSTWSATKALYK